MMTVTWDSLFERLVGSDAATDGGVWLDDFGELMERIAEEHNRLVSDEPLMLAAKRTRAPDRLMVATFLWTLSIRTHQSALECFLLPSAEVTALMEAESPARCKLRLRSDTNTVSVDGAPITVSEFSTLIRSLVKDVILRSQNEFESMPESIRLVYGGQSLTGSVRSLVAEKHVLVQKIVNQQEIILSQIARDLHDSVLGNIMILERSLSGGKSMSNEDMIKLVTECSSQLRDICHDLYPRDLRDCGLAPLLQEMCSSLSERTGLAYSFECLGQMPSLPEEVLLHAYRIAQECCNNSAKHAAATQVDMVLQREGQKLTLRVQDNGRGFSPDEPKSAGMGTNILRERAELIESFLPCTLLVDSHPGRGTTVTLQITL